MSSLSCRFLVILVLLALSGCSNLPVRFASSQQVSTPSSVGTPETAEPLPATEEPLASPSPQATITQELQPSSTPVQPLVSLVRLWLPPEFDPENAGEASALLKTRLEQFEDEHPGIKVEVRIKALDGAGGLLESLTAASVSAPLTLPDLVLLPRPLFESAALKGLLTPLDGLTDVMDDRNWFSYAQQLSRLKTNTYGLPFAGDSMILAYKPTLTGTAPHTLDAANSLGGVMLFPAADPQALYTLSMYLDAGGGLQDTQGRPLLDKLTLMKVLEFEQRASLAGVMPYWMTQYAGDAQVWDAFAGGQFPMAVTWASTYLQNLPNNSEDMAVSPLPTWDGSPFTLATGWSWAMAGQDPERSPLTIQLLEFLVDKEFLAAWTQAAGYLPPRVDALQSWDDSTLRQAFEQISYSAQVVPPVDLISSVGPELTQAVIAVLKAESDPGQAAQVVIEQVSQP